MHVDQTTFQAGPLVINEADTIVKLTSNITFDFGKEHPTESPFHRGFFAGIIIGASRVVVDLNGYEVSMSRQYQTIQRFFSLISLDVAPLPAGKIGFSTEFVRPCDIVIRNGTMSLTSHFAIHMPSGSQRVLIEDLRIDNFEISAISLSGCSDLCIRNLNIGGPVAPATTSEAAMLRSLVNSLEASNAPESLTSHIRERLHKEEKVRLQSLDCIVRAIVIVPKFNVGAVPEKVDTYIQRIRISDIKFSKIVALPVETIAASTTQGGQPFKDINGDVISYADLMAHTHLCRAQLLVSTNIDNDMRNALVQGTMKLHQIHGLDRRGHDLKKKASAFVRVDGATDVDISNIDAETISTKGEQATAVGFMFNVCKEMRLNNIRIREAFNGNDSCSPLDDIRPFSGFYLRNCENVIMTKLMYPNGPNCACMLHKDQNVRMTNCTFDSPVASNNSSAVHIQ
jgi:hypothetical protein